MKENSPIKNSTSQRNVGLDIMRGFALIMVFGAHTLHLFTAVFPPIALLSHVLRNGVEVYFSLSGFLIGNILLRQFHEQEQASSLLHFYKRRWIRTLPLYYLGIIINLIAGIFITGNYQDFNWKFLLFLQNFSETGFWFYPISYSLCIEEWFYLVFPLLLIPTCYLFKKNRVNAMILLSVVYILAATYTRYYIFKNDDPHWDADMRKTLICRLDAGVYGIIMAAIFNRHQHTLSRYRRELLAIGIVMFFMAVFIHLRMYNGVINYVWYFNIVPLAFALCIPWFYSFSFRIDWFNRLFTWLSFISFAFYIIHLSPVMEVIVLFIPTDNWPSVITAFLLFTCTSLGFAHLLNVYFEKPIMNLNKQ